MGERYLKSVRLLAECMQGFERFSGESVRECGLTHAQFDIIATLGNTPVNAVLLPTVSAAELFIGALGDQGVRYALRELNGFALTGASLYGRFTRGELSLEQDNADAGQLTAILLGVVIGYMLITLPLAFVVHRVERRVAILR